MKKYLLWVGAIILTLLVTFLLPSSSSIAQDAEPLPSQAPGQGIEQQIEQAVLEAVAVNSRYQQGKLVANLQVSDIQVSQDQQWSTAWVVYYDFQVEALIPTEPGLAVSKYINDDWQVYLPSEAGWQEALYAVPEDLLSKGEKDMWVAMNQGSEQSTETLTGYYLPWHGGQTASLSRSVGHDADFTTAHYAFDFYVGGTTICPNAGDKGAESSGSKGLNFEIYAAKAGTVWGWKDSVENCNHNDVNFIVIRNVDDPSIFQLYMHLSQNSIPAALKSVGAPVARGQFIAIADNTGASSGSHLHFQVEHQPYWPAANPYWAVSLDMAFADVSINQGHPRASPLDPPYCRDNDICDVFQTNYVSGNYYMGDAEPPTGGLNGITNGAIVTTDKINLSGWGTDSQSGLDHGQLRAYFDGSWHDLGPEFNPSFSYTWDLCNAALPVENGAVSVAVALYDQAGNTAPLVGLRNFIKNYACPIPRPACIPGANQVTLFEDAYYEGGCVKFNVGSYPTAESLNPLGNDDADSILVGADVIATLYSGDNFSGHSQSVITDAAFIKYQWVAGDSLSSMKIGLKQSLPAVPVPLDPLGATAFREGDVIPFSWKNAGGAVDFQVEIYRNNILVQTLPWQRESVVSVGSLAQGDYTWRVIGRNAAGASPWSGYSTFSIVSPIAPPAVKTVPYSDTMETSQALWAREGLWSYINNAAKARSGTHAWWYQNSYGNYDTGAPNSGSLTSPPFSINTPGYYLRFYYRYESETQGNTWDQRWVQISVDGGPFQNLTQYSEDPIFTETSSWLLTKAIDLSPYAGHVIRVRFQFTTWDAEANNYTGWGIDDFSISANAPENCDDNRQDDTPAQAYLLTYDPSIRLPGAICPNGDVDYYRFYGEAGDRIAVDIDAMSDGSLLDPYLYLLDTDGKTVLAENDDEIYIEYRDSLIGYTLEKDGFYYLKLRAWKNPLVGGNNYFYKIRLYEDHVQPQVSITWPSSYIYLPDASMTVTANVTDMPHGINRVEFYWHSTNWLPGAWEKIGEDRDEANGWSMDFDPAGEPEGNLGAFKVKAYDFAGNTMTAGAWNLGIDKTAPVTEMKALAATQPSNAFLLEWSAWDNLSGIDYFEVQEKKNSASWVTLAPIEGNLANTWIIGTPGNTYAYRMHAVDHSGNSEAYPTNPEASTSLPSAAVLCGAPDGYDSAGNDNSPAEASEIIANGASQVHNYCNPLRTDFQNDEDWVKLNVIQGENYFIHSHVTRLQSASIISLFAADGSTLIAEAMPHHFGDSTVLNWSPDQDQTVYIRFKHLDGRVIGSVVEALVYVTTGSTSFMPLVNK